MTTTEKQTPPECCPVDIVLALKAEHAQTWRDKNDHFWLAGLVEEVLELTSALEGRHKHAPEVELTQIAAIALNWLELRALRTGATLQSVSNPEVWAAGDCSARDDAPHPASGVYAVRAGPPLAASLRAAVGGVAPPSYVPQQRSLNLISCGSRSAILAWGDWSAAGRWAWWWKDRIDRAFIARYVRL